MKKLKLPIIKDQPYEPRVLSMDEYLEFVMFNLEHTVDREAADEYKKLMEVNVPFKIK